MTNEEMIECCVRIEKASKDIDALCVKLLGLSESEGLTTEDNDKNNEVV